VENAAVGARQKMMAVSLLLPALLVARVASHIVRTRRYAGAFLRAFPALVLISTVWAWGEFIGYATARPDKSLAVRTV
jgi:hypothetical protein